MLPNNSLDVLDLKSQKKTCHQFIEHFSALSNTIKEFITSKLCKKKNSFISLSKLLFSSFSFFLFFSFLDCPFCAAKQNYLNYKRTHIKNKPDNHLTNKHRSRLNRDEVDVFATICRCTTTTAATTATTTTVDIGSVLEQVSLTRDSTAKG